MIPEPVPFCDSFTRCTGFSISKDLEEHQIMKKRTTKKLTMTSTMCSYCSRVWEVVVLTLIILWPFKSMYAAEFFCPSGNVTCLIAAINEANGMLGEHVINLEPGIYTLQQAIGNVVFGGTGLPSITGSIRIHPSAENSPTIIERDLNAAFFRILQISSGGELILDKMILQRGRGNFGTAIFNQGMLSLQDSIVTDNSFGEAGAIHNLGTLNVIRSIIADNVTGHEGGGISNETAGVVLVENSTIDHNGSADGGGIFNRGTLVVRNSAITSNSTDCCQPGGGILNLGGSVEIVNSTIAQNRAGGLFGQGGGGVANFSGQVSIINSTIRENQVFSSMGGRGGGILSDGGSLRLQNTIVAGNSLASQSFTSGPDCSGIITSVGNNLVGDPSGCDIDLQPTDLIGDPGLDSLVGTGEEDPPGMAHYPVLTGSPVIGRGDASSCPETDQLGNPRGGTCDIGAVESQQRILVAIDVRPRGDANKINPSSTKNINVAIFSVDGFDATTVDAATVRFGATGTEAAPINVVVKDRDRDKDRDMTVRFRIQDTGIKCGDTSVSLTAQTSTGVSIVGSTSITTHCKTPKASK
jgi:hypothetical protein